MKLTEVERKALALIRRLDERQREKILARMQREVLANQLVKKALGLRKLKIASDRNVERAFGAVPTWRTARRKTP